ncbi:MAG: pseudouridine synthase [Lachnospiraceae bacterium]|nr:pseudouridine synthase [Lachnospiraceae bacterium]
MEAIRINKYLSEAGVLSRRKADEAIARGEVLVNGKLPEPGTKVSLEDEVTYLGKVVRPVEDKVVLAYYKPIGLICTSAESDPNSIFRKLNYPKRLIYVGRLDQASQGLLLLTNDGELSNQIQKARNGHEKEYVVRVDKPITDEFVSQASKGGLSFEDLGERKTKPCKIIKQGSQSFRIILTEGINREIRRICEYYGYRVTYLKRIRVMNINLGELQPGEYRELTNKEIEELKKSIR